MIISIIYYYYYYYYYRIEWEGVPQSVAFSYPYIIGFDPRFIEVRHVETVGVIHYYYKYMFKIIH